jgi:hypothetical protein
LILAGAFKSLLARCAGARIAVLAFQKTQHLAISSSKNTVLSSRLTKTIAKSGFKQYASLINNTDPPATVDHRHKEYLIGHAMQHHTGKIDFFAGGRHVQELAAVDCGAGKTEHDVIPLRDEMGLPYSVVSNAAPASATRVKT